MDESRLYIKEELWGKFCKNAEQLGFNPDDGGGYARRQQMTETEDELALVFYISSYDFGIELWMEFRNAGKSGLIYEASLADYEVLWRLCAEGYLEVK